jgi:uncharacterized membrane protein
MIAVHTIVGVIALAAGLAVVVLQKGTRTHRLIGRLYALAMYALCLSSFAIPAALLPLVGDYGIFHLFALFGTVHLTIGLAPILWRGSVRNWYTHHLYFMLWSFVGLIMATNSHFFPYVGALFMRGVGLSSTVSMVVTGVLLWGLPMMIGAPLIERKKAKYTKQFGVGREVAGS